MHIQSILAIPRQKKVDIFMGIASAFMGLLHGGSLYSYSYVSNCQYKNERCYERCTCSIAADERAPAKKSDKNNVTNLHLKQ
jgi:hypothetical protein